MKRFFLILLVVLVVVFFALAYFAFEWSGVHAALAWIVVYTLMSSCCVAAIFMILKLLMSAFSPELRADLWSRGMHVFRACLMLFAYLFVLIPLIFGALLYGLHEWWPAKLSRYELTNGEKTVIFQSMSHLASQDFYDRVREDIRAR